MRGQKEDYVKQRNAGIREGWAQYLSPGILYALILTVQFAGLLVLIIPQASGLLLLAYLFVLAGMVLRWRIKLAPHYMLLDCGIVCVAALLEPGVGRFLFIYVYYFAWNNKLPFALIPAALSLYILKDFYLLLPLQALLIGFVLYLWKREITAIYKENDGLRQKLYRMEQTELKLLSDYQNTERISRLKERQRLAEQLHDTLGHELTAAHLSVKATGTLMDMGEYPKAQDAQKKAEERLNSALRQLKKSVSRLEPDRETDIENIAALFKRFIYPVNLQITGDASDVQAYHIQLLYGAVKEALTNIAKHSVPARIDANLEIHDRIIKVGIENDGIKNEAQERPGNGLRYMRKRIEAVQGSLSSGRTGDKFRIIIILPKEQ